LSTTTDIKPLLTTQQLPSTTSTSQAPDDALISEVVVFQTATAFILSMPEHWRTLPIVSFSSYKHKHHFTSQVCVGVQQLLRIGVNIPSYFISVIIDALTRALRPSSTRVPNVNVVSDAFIGHTTVRVFRALLTSNRSIELVSRV